MASDNPALDSFVEQLVEQTRLTERQAQVYTLRKCNFSREGIADLFDISEGAVDSHYSSARDVVANQLFGRELHFYRSRTGRVPLDWQSWFTADRTSYILSEPRTDLIAGGGPHDNLVAGNVVTLEDDVVFLTVHQGDRIDDEAVIREGPTQYLPLDDMSLEEIGRGLRMVFDAELGEHEAQVFELAFEEFVGEDVTRREFYQAVFGEGEFVITDSFLSKIYGETRFIVFSESAELSSYHEQLLIGKSIETERPVFLDKFDFDSWLSIVGKIGSGKSFTLDLLLSQITHDEDVSVVEFNPFVDKRESDGEYELHPESDRVEGGAVDAWFDAVFEYVEMDDNPVYGIADEAHYLLRERPERFAELVALADEDESFRLITTTQTFTEFMEAGSEMEEMLASGSWLFHQLDSVPEEAPMNLSERVKHLDVGVKERGAGAILIEGDASQGFEFTVSINGFTV